MKTLLLVMMLGLVSVPAFADMTFVQKVQTGAMMGQPAHSDTMTWAIKGSKARLDFGKMWQIVDLDAHKVYIVDVASKQVMVKSTELPKETTDAVSAMAADMKFDLHKTGKTDTIQGYKCEEYLMTMSGPMEMTSSMWVTEGIDSKEFDRFKSFGMQMPKVKGSESIAAMKGIPVRSTSKTTVMGNVIESSTEMQSISHEAVSASLFELPKDYKVMDMPVVHAPKTQR